MPSFLQLLTFAALAVVGSAAPTDAQDVCPGATLELNSTITFNGNAITYTSHSCSFPDTTLSRRGLLDSPPLCWLLGTCKPKPAKPPPAPKSVCGNSCNLSCNNVTGILPPISDDCQTIQDSITILQNAQSDVFTVDANHVETLTFGTCSFFFENFSTKQLDYCWSSLSVEGGAAGSACFPPNQPFFPQGLCTATDGTWAVGATHS